MKLDNKLGPNATWLFALVTLGVAIAITHFSPSVTKAITPKAMAAIYFAVFGAGATASMLLTRASALGVVGRFALSGIGLGIFYYFTIARVADHVVEGLGGSGAGKLGTTLGLMYAIGFAFEATLAAIAGVVFGNKIRRASR